MDPLKSWLIVGLVGASAAIYYTQSGKSKRGRGRATATLAGQIQQRASSSRNDSKVSRKKKAKGKASDGSDQAASDAADFSSASPQTSPSERVKKTKAGKEPPSKHAHSSAVEVSKIREVDVPKQQEEDDEGMSNVEFAKQLSQLKTGTSLKKPVTDNEIKKTTKQGKRNELPPDGPKSSPLQINGISSSQNMSTASSTTGADADDDLSVPVSPDLGATEATTPSGLDVSDMLETTSKGPSILRLTGPVNQQSGRQLKPQKTAPEPETKKQRQNRKRKEDNKAIREQAEKDRHVLLEKQRRTAREAEGRPAKNGVGTAKSPVTNAWADSASAGKNSKAPLPVPNNGTLLDTLEESTPVTEAGVKEVNVPGNGVSGGRRTWNKELPSEEEQMRLITEMDSDNAWSTVPKGKGKKRSAVAGAGAGAYDAEPSGSKTPSSDNVASSYATSQAPRNDHYKSRLPFAETEIPRASNDSQEITDFTDGPSLRPSATEGERRAVVSEYGVYKKEWREKRWSDGRLRADDQVGEMILRTKATRSGMRRVIKKRPRRPKATYDTIDRDSWTSQNITEHPDYDPVFHYALTGHPADSDWDGGQSI